jgi:hypothetical protein
MQTPGFIVWICCMFDASLIAGMINHGMLEAGPVKSYPSNSEWYRKIQKTQHNMEKQDDSPSSK